MNLTKEKLQSLWKIRNQIFQDEKNKIYIERFKRINELFDKILNTKIEISNNTILIENNTISTKISANTDYFGIVFDDLSGNRNVGDEGILIMAKELSNNNNDLSQLISDIGCMLGGFNFINYNTQSSVRLQMIEEFRIVSNSITGKNDNTTISCGQAQHPSSHFADNNYFFRVIESIKQMKKDNFDPKVSNISLRWPKSAVNKTNEKESEDEYNKLKYEYREILQHRFPYKYFYMWAHKDEIIHLLGLMSYQNLVKQNDAEIKYNDDKIDQKYNDFITEWKSHSEQIISFISEEERGDHFISEISMLLSIILIQDQEIKNISELIETGNRAIILCGSPGTGKTYQAKELVKAKLKVGLNEKLDDYIFNPNKISDNGCYTLVQFHPNYTYEDFMGGISPKLEGNSLSYYLKVGIFKQICDCANKEENKCKKFYFIIDEINRADLSSIFGELLYALEYREEGITIPNFPEKFTIPNNVYIIGTMNNIDKSLVTFDLALRRRFSFFKMAPNLNVLYNILEDLNIDSDNLDKYIERCKNLNINISEPQNKYQLGSDYQIGQAYFGKIKDFLPKNNENPIIISTFELEKLWNYHIEPLLDEYLGGKIENDNIAKNIEKEKNEFIKPL